MLKSSSTFYHYYWYYHCSCCFCHNWYFWVGFFFQLLLPKNQLGKEKMNAWQGKMVSFLSLVNTCMASQYALDQTKLGKENLALDQHFMQDHGQIYCRNNATSGQYLKYDCSKGTHRTHKQISKHFSSVFTLLPHCVYAPRSWQYNDALPPTEGQFKCALQGLGEYNLNFGLLKP